MRRSALGGLATLLVGSVVLTGCSLPGGGPGADDSAEGLATALTGKDVAKVRFSGTTGAAAQKDLAAITERMKGLKPRVSAVDVAEDGDDATGVLVWKWTLPGTTWTTRSPISLRKVGDAWRPVWKPSVVYPKLTVGETLRATDLLATRGDVIGANGRRIVTNRAVVAYGLDKTGLSVDQAAASARQLAALLKIDAAAFATRVSKAGASSYVPAITLRAEEKLPTQAELAQVPGSRSTPGQLPLAPTKDFAAPLLGSVGQPTAEMVQKSGGTLQATDQVGLDGLQARYEKTLHGTNGMKISVVDPKGDGTEVFRSEPIAGKPLTLTLDVNAQTVAEQALAGTTSASALVAIRPSTGDVVAAASGPASKGYNTATFGRYAPGSTFKIVSSLALLRGGVTPDTQVDCPPTVTVDGKRFKNYDDYPSSALGRIPFRTAIANSCNTAVIGQRDKLGRDSLSDAAAALGLGVDHDTGFPAYFGAVPAAASETEGAADMIGQGKVQASPMTMASVIASVQQGAAVVPRLIADSEPITATPGKPLTKTEADQLRTLLRGVVTDGSGKLLLDLPGAPVIAKTGTAEYGSPGPDGSLKTHAWMVAAHGDLAVAVFVDDGASGSGTAGPILKAFLQGVS
ncbi:MAG: penicillin-binding protein transpeptidase [Nocardioidaceae bacterium]|nr:penicillin-binding protein transpeptidase [Nocardioidaceae bacterium]